MEIHIYYGAMMNEDALLKEVMSKEVLEKEALVKEVMEKEIITPNTLFRCLADNTRLQLLLLIQAKGELCVCDLMAALDISQPKVSRHLQPLRESGLLLTRKTSQWVHYRLNPELDDWVKTVLEQTAVANPQLIPTLPQAGCC
tara:strand:+ start:98973 stop:99401 length:429 start_codon:yes stop_codon:yes gene_type:complete